MNEVPMIKGMSSEVFCLINPVTTSTAEKTFSALRKLKRSYEVVVHDMVILTDSDGMCMWRYHYLTGMILSSYY